MQLLGSQNDMATIRLGGYLLWQPGGHDFLSFRSLALRPWFLPGLLFLLGVRQSKDKNLIIWSGIRSTDRD